MQALIDRYERHSMIMQGASIKTIVYLLVLVAAAGTVVERT